MTRPVGAGAAREGRHARRSPHILLLMAESLRELLADLERDAGCRDRCGVYSTGGRLPRRHAGRRRARVDGARPRRSGGALRGAAAGEGRPLEEVLARLSHDVLPDCNRLTHPRSMGHQVSAPLPVAVWTEALTAALNQSGAVCEMSPVGTIIETQVVRWMCDLAGFGPGGRRHVHLRRHRGHVRRPARGAPGGHAGRMAQGRRRRPAGRGLRRTRALRRGAGGR